MKRDMDLVRQILLAIENLESVDQPVDLNFDDHTSEEVSYHVMLLDEADQHIRVDSEFALGDRLQRRRDREHDVGEREADGLLAEVKAEEPLAFVHKQSEFSGIGEDHRPPTPEASADEICALSAAVALAEARWPISMRLPAGSRTKKRVRPSAVPPSSIAVLWRAIV